MRKTNTFDRIFFSLLNEDKKICEKTSQNDYYSRKKELTDKQKLQLQQLSQKQSLQLNTLRRKQSIDRNRLRKRHQQQLRNLNRKYVR